MKALKTLLGGVFLLLGGIFNLLAFSQLACAMRERLPPPEMIPEEPTGIALWTDVLIVLGGWIVGTFLIWIASKLLRSPSE